MDNKSIKCSVISCRFCDDKTEYCTKSVIKIANCKGILKEGTMCDSYKDKM